MLVLFSMYVFTLLTFYIYSLLLHCNVKKSCEIEIV